jgi:hypothetical protein
MWSPDTSTAKCGSSVVEAMQPLQCNLKFNVCSRMYSSIGWERRRKGDKWSCPKGVRYDKSAVK